MAWNTVTEGGVMKTKGGDIKMAATKKGKKAPVKKPAPKKK